MSATTRLALFGLLLVSVFFAAWFAADLLVPNGFVTAWNESAWNGSVQGPAH